MRSSFIAVILGVVGLVGFAAGVATAKQAPEPKLTAPENGGN
jgi:hypothetical protein